MHLFPSTWDLMHCIPVQGITVYENSMLIPIGITLFGLTSSNKISMVSKCVTKNVALKKIKIFNSPNDLDLKYSAIFR